MPFAFVGVIFAKCVQAQAASRTNICALRGVSAAFFRMLQAIGIFALAANGAKVRAIGLTLMPLTLFVVLQTSQILACAAYFAQIRASFAVADVSAAFLHMLETRRPAATEAYGANIGTVRQGIARHCRQANECQNCGKQYCVQSFFVGHVIFLPRAFFVFRLPRSFCLL